MGNRNNEPLSARQAAELMRDVTADEIPPLVAELNRRYQAESAPYCIASGSHGYRLVLRREFHPLRYGRIREARLSQAAIDVFGAGGLSAAGHRRADPEASQQAEQARIVRTCCAAGCCASSGRRPAAARRTTTRPIVFCDCSTSALSTIFRAARRPVRHKAGIGVWPSSLIPFIATTCD